MFYSIPCVWNMIAARQTDFIEKIIQGPPNCPSRNMITACCNHKRRVGRPQTTGKIFMVENLRLLFQDVNTVHIDQFGSLQDWIHKASDKGYWNQLVDRLLNPNMPLPDRLEAWGPLPSWRARRATNGRRPLTTTETTTMTAVKTMETTTEMVAMENHEDANNPPHHQDEHPPHTSRKQVAHPPLANMNQKNGSTTPIFANKSGAACFIHLPFLGLGSAHLRLKSKSTTDNLPANITPTRTTLPSPASQHPRPLNSLSS
jgi:hypothetical protein